MHGKKILISALTGFITLGIATPSLALMSIPNGWYLEGNLGSTKISNKNYPGSASTSGLGANANLGYKFMPYFGAELGYSRYAQTTVKDQLGNKAANDTHYSYDLAFRGILPAADTGLEAFAKVGVGRVASHLTVQGAVPAANLGLSNSQHTSTGIYWGGGVQYYFMPEVAAIVQWQRAQANSNVGTMDLFSGGVSFIFD